MFNSQAVTIYDWMIERMLPRDKNLLKLPIPNRFIISKYWLASILWLWLTDMTLPSITWVSFELALAAVGWGLMWQWLAGDPSSEAWTAGLARECSATESQLAEHSLSQGCCHIYRCAVSHAVTCNHKTIVPNTCTTTSSKQYFLFSNSDINYLLLFLFSYI